MSFSSKNSECIVSIVSMGAYLAIFYQIRLTVLWGLDTYYGSFKSTQCSSLQRVYCNKCLKHQIHRYRIYCIIGQTSRVVSRTRIGFISYRLLSSHLPAPGRVSSHNTVCSLCHQWCIDLLQC